MGTRSMRRILQAAAIAAITAVLGCNGGGPPTNPQALPTDAQASCTVPAMTFNGWFQSGTPSLNGVVNPANSVTFSNALNNCVFYQWSKQMFLWLTSPSPATYGGGGGRIFASPAFFDVSPIQADGHRVFLAHSAPGGLALGLRAAQAGPLGLQVIFDRTGRPLQVAIPAKSAKPMVRDVTGKLVQIAHARLGQDGRPVLLDQSGAVITAQKSAPTKDGDRPKARLSTVVQKFTIDGLGIFIDPALAIVDVEQGQAVTNSVLESQTGSLVYFETITNDVYAYFLTGAADGAITPKPTQFPTSAADLAKITAFASAHGVTFPDPNALAIECKTAWVEASTVPSSTLNTYITTTATIPTYDTSNPQKWVLNGKKTVQLALVGFHIVGSVNGHPEMVWATFEHVANAPRLAYQYINASNQTITVPQNTASAWLFSANGSSGPFNQAHMQLDATTPTTIDGITGSFNPSGNISASDTMRTNPFGANSDALPNPLDTSIASANTEVISINNNVGGMLPSGDVRNNYVMTGATWTENGESPTSPFSQGGNEVGTSQLMNDTMETYVQGAGTKASGGGLNCLDCHSSNTTSVSHVFPLLKPLF